ITTHIICLTNDKFIDKKKENAKFKKKARQNRKKWQRTSTQSASPFSCSSSWWLPPSEAQTFCFECGPVPFLGTNADCFNCCKTKYGSPPVVSGVVEGKILKSEAQTFCFECGPVPFLGTNADGFNCCKSKYGSPPVVSGVVEGIPHTLK
ncbi:hypothetical protein HID58_043164, partial [Brassica napus]